MEIMVWNSDYAQQSADKQYHRDRLAGGFWLATFFNEVDRVGEK